LPNGHITLKRKISLSSKAYASNLTINRVANSFLWT